MAGPRRQRGPDSEPPIDLDTMLDLTADGRGRRDEVRRRRSVPVRPARQHRLDRRRPEAARRQDPAAKKLVVGSLVAPVWPPTGGGSAMGSEEERKHFLTQVRKACASAGSCATSASARTASSASIRRRARPTGRRTRRATRRRSPRRSARPATSPRTTASGSPPRARSAGAACTAGSAMVELLEHGRPAEDARLPGRHGAHAALHDGLQRARGSHPARRTSTGRIRPTSRRGAAAR